jgi:hypothetical protein
MTQSLCETCTWMREVITSKGSRFLLCQLSKTRPDYPKYPPQPVIRCSGYEPNRSPKELTETDKDASRPFVSPAAARTWPEP